VSVTLDPIRVEAWFPYTAGIMSEIAILSSILMIIHIFVSYISLSPPGGTGNYTSTGPAK